MAEEKYSGDIRFADSSVESVNYYRAVFAGCHSILAPGASGGDLSARELDFRAAYLPYLQEHKDPKFPPHTPTRIFHNITHPLGTSGEVMPVMEEVHNYIKAHVPNDRALTMEDAQTLYRKAMSRCRLTPADKRRGALLDSSGYWHDTVYNCDEVIQKDILVLLHVPYGPLEEKDGELHWTEQGKKEFAYEYQLLEKLGAVDERYKPPYGMPPLGKPHNEILSALAAASSLKRMRAPMEMQFPVFVAIVNTVPFHPHAFQEHFEQSVYEVAGTFELPNYVARQAVNLGLNFTNGADFGSITHAYKVGRRDRFAERSLHLAYENQPLLKIRGDRLTGSELTACLMGSIFFAENIIHDPLTKPEGGVFAVEHASGGDAATTTLAANRRAALNFKREALINKARCVSALLAESTLYDKDPATLQSHFKGCMVEGDSYCRPLGKSSRPILEKTPTERITAGLLECHSYVEPRYGTTRPIGLPTDDLASELLDHLGPAGIHSLYMTLMPALREKDIHRRADRVSELRDSLAAKACELFSQRSDLTALINLVRQLSDDESLDRWIGQHWLSSAEESRTAMRSNIFKQKEEEERLLAEARELDKAWQERLREVEALEEKLAQLRGKVEANQKKSPSRRKH